ncbi:MAG: hypothetical protein J6S49_07320, partial [Erysipelotrichaceae bacterium]|nr:hypothetical protein [Erysipelotrichaceae bacterium]
YFTSSREDICKDSDCVIEYLNNDGYLKGNSEKRFSYIEEDLDKGKIFDLLKTTAVCSKRRIITHS